MPREHLTADAGEAYEEEWREKREWRGKNAIKTPSVLIICSYSHYLLIF
jgi:hypothetical protein